MKGALATLLVVIVALGAAAVAAPATTGEIAAIEMAFATHAGEGASGVKRVSRDGCYVIESEGGTGGRRARDSQAGCHRAADVADAFRRVEALAGQAVVPEGGPAPSRITLVRGDGSRWVAAGDETARALAGALDDLPSENQWYAPPPEPPLGKGAQLVVLSASAPGRGGGRRLQGALAADGRWWCYRSAGASDAEGEPRLPARRPARLSPVEAGARLGRILRGAGQQDVADAASTRDRGGDETSVEVAFTGGTRGPLLPRGLARTVIQRFSAEMRAQSPACVWP